MKQKIAFISDLHLDPSCKLINKRWNDFVKWASFNIQELYILGDFFAVWAGDDLVDDFSKKVTNQIKNLINQGLKVYFLPGNRDFLLGEHFSKLCGWELLPEQKLIDLNGNKVLILHGDELCTQDKAHQRFRKLSRNKFIRKLFLILPKSFRINVVNKIRSSSKAKTLTYKEIQISEPMIRELFTKYRADIIVHGHIHTPLEIDYVINAVPKKRFVLSDWDDIPKILVYNVSTNHFSLRDYYGPR
jgi:UDP-2,3-diacylglucosamine hydrolase